ncbi:MAG: hypothetical protein EB015_13370 [Methylocystaceae bacterium]|nr:hypothetical protein [Methylocystaceae bacterium]
MIQETALPECQFKKASPRKALRCLDRRGERLVELMTLGLTSEEASSYPDLPACEPLTLEQAARVIGLKMKNARFIFASAPFLKAYSANLGAIRNGHKARAVAVLAEVMNTAGDGLASDRAVRIKAASQLLNDGDGRPGSQVNLQINNGGQVLAPGIVIRLPASAPTTPLELQEGVASLQQS